MVDPCSTALSARPRISAAGGSSLSSRTTTWLALGVLLGPVLLASAGEAAHHPQGRAAVAAVGDFTGDGLTDVLAWRDTHRTVLDLHAAGGVAWSIRIAGATEPTAQPADLDGDDVLDVLLSRSEDALPCPPGSLFAAHSGPAALAVAVRGRDGATLWSDRHDACNDTSEWVGGGYAVGPDLDGDGTADVWRSIERLHAYAYVVEPTHPRTTEAHVLSGSTGQPVWELPLALGILLGGGRASPLDDVVGDRTPDTLVQQGRTAHVIDGGTRAIAWSHATDYRGPQWVGDLDGDGRADAIVGMDDFRKRALSGATGGVLWTTSEKWFDIQALDPRDGGAGLIATTHDHPDARQHRVAVLDAATGAARQQTSVPWGSDAWHTTSARVTDDLTGDGLRDALVHLVAPHDGSDRSAITLVDAVQARIAWTSDAPGHHADAVGDLDGDGRGNLIISRIGLGPGATLTAIDPFDDDRVLWSRAVPDSSTYAVMQGVPPLAPGSPGRDLVLSFGGSSWTQPPVLAFWRGATGDDPWP